MGIEERVVSRVSLWSRAEMLDYMIVRALESPIEGAHRTCLGVAVERDRSSGGALLSGVWGHLTNRDGKN